MNASRLALLVALSIGANVAFADTVYQSVDENGNPVYSDRPSDYAATDTIELDIVPTDPSVIEQEQYAAAELSRARQVRESQEAETAAEEAQRQATVAEQRASNCTLAKDRLQKYNANRKLYKPLPDGGREYLSSEEIDAARVEAARTVDEWCS